MKFSRITILAAAGMAFASPAWAACNPSLSSNVSGVVIGTPGCDVIWNDAPTLPVTTGQVDPSDPAPVPGAHGIEVIIKDKATNKVGTDGGKIVDVINANAHTMAKNDAILDARTQALKAKNDEQDVTLATHNDQIADLYDLNAGQQQALNAHSALLSQHTAKLEEHARGLAIAMALPDLYLSDKERFSIAGNLGGFNGETAIGFGAIARIDQTFALTGKVGTDTEFKEFGWSVGARAGF